MELNCLNEIIAILSEKLGFLDISYLKIYQSNTEICYIDKLRLS